MSAQGVDRDDPTGKVERMIEIEIKVAYLDDLLDTLNRTVFRQQQQIDQLVQALAALRQQSLTSAPVPGTDPRDELPPHY
jgi:SlyX protein